MSKLTKTIGIAGAAAGAAVGAVFLSKSENREKVKEQLGKLVGKDEGEDNQDYVEKLGRPGAYGETEDAKMVDEGALTSVQYYNKLQEEEEEKE